MSHTTSDSRSVLIVNRSYSPSSWLTWGWLCARDLWLCISFSWRNPSLCSAPCLSFPCLPINTHTHTHKRKERLSLDMGQKSQENIPNILLPCTRKPKLNTNIFSWVIKFQNILQHFQYSIWSLLEKYMCKLKPSRITSWGKILFEQLMHVLFLATGLPLGFPSCLHRSVQKQFVLHRRKKVIQVWDDMRLS